MYGANDELGFMDEKEGILASKHQAAGHRGCLVMGERNLIFAKLTTAREIDFYHETQISLADDDGQVLGTKLSDWMPTYMGTLRENVAGDGGSNSVVFPVLGEDRAAVEALASARETNNKQDDGDNEKQYIVLENLYCGFLRPSIVDIKLGSVLYDEFASAEKVERLRQVSRNTTSGSLGFRICGMKVYNGDLKEVPDPIFGGMGDTMTIVHEETENCQYIEFNKYFGRSLTRDDVGRGLELVFNWCSDQRIRQLLIGKFLQRLKLLYNCLLDAEIRVVSGSLLLIMESDPTRWAPVLEDPEAYEALDPLIAQSLVDDDSDEDEANHLFAPLSRLNFIDFAHAKYVKGKGYDENIVEGVENLINLFEQMLV